MAYPELLSALEQEIDAVEEWVKAAPEEAEGLDMVLRLLVVIRYLRMEMERWGCPCSAQ